MTKKRIFLHIGTHKTATTTIQNGCCENRENLLAAGWLYPTTGMYLFGQHNIAWEMCSGHEQPWNHVNEWVRFRPESGGIQALLSEIEASPASNVIVSSEDFDGMQTDRIQKLHSLLADYQVEVIVYLREQSSLLQSAWAQFVKSGYVIEDFETFIDRMLNSSDQVLRYFGAYDVFLHPWMEMFGADHVHSRPFSRDAFKGHVFHDFLHTCQLPEPEIFPIPENQNVSPGYKTLEMIRLMCLDIPQKERRRMVTHFIQWIGFEKHWDNGKLNLIDASHHARIQKRFAGANQFLSEQFNGGKPFFDTSFKEKPLSKFDKSSITGEEWEAFSREITTRLVNEFYRVAELHGE